jgi:purine catabolism regulator
VAITVDELVAVPFLKLRFHAGAAGGPRLVTWAHGSDLPNATDWLGEGDLLMTNGTSLPEAADAQASFLAGLASTGLSGLAVGDDMPAPQLREGLLKKADELAFPVLGIPRDVPFVAVSRAVASANSDEEHGRLVRTVQLYETLRGRRSTRELLDELGRQLGCRLLLLDTATGLAVVPDGNPLPPGLSAHLEEELRTRGGAFPGVLRVRNGSAAGLAIRVRGERSVTLIALDEDETTPDLPLLHHAASIAALEVERIHAEREQSRARGSELLAQMLERRHEPAAALRELEVRGIAAERAVLVAFRGDGVSAGEDDLHHGLTQRGLAHLLLWTAPSRLVALPDREGALADLRAALGAGAVFGVSDPLCRPDRARDAAREARWAEMAAQTLGRPLVRYGESTPLFLPRTLGEAEMAADRVLGPLLAYDAEHSTDLCRSLAVFLEHNRSWQRAGEALHVHKQTLVYRMRRVEQLTKRDLRATGDVVELWLALRARELARGEPAER